jgi:hypothetical protein
MTAWKISRVLKWMRITRARYATELGQEFTPPPIPETRHKRDPHVRELAEKHGIKVNTLHDRLNRGWSLEDALTTPVARRIPRSKWKVIE